MQAFLNTAPLVHEPGAILNDDAIEGIISPVAAHAATEVGTDERFDSGDPFSLARGLVIAIVITVGGVSLGLAATEVISRLI